MNRRSNEARKGPDRTPGASLGLPALLALVALLALLPALAGGCASAPRETDAADQKAWGTKMARQGFWREALFRYQRAAALKPDDPQILSNVAVALEANGEPAKALVAYRRALELAPQDQQIKRNYARFAEYYTSTQRIPTSPGAETAAPTAPAAPAAPAVPAAPAAPATPTAPESPR